jgi:4'-phosphopantetheinyl transferase
MIKVYSVRFDENVDRNCIEPLYPFLSQYTIQRIKDFHFLQDAVRCSLGEVLVKYAIGETFEIPLKDICFLRNEYGKPFVKGREGIHFNISHSAERIVCAVSSQPVGVDIEKVTSIDTLAVARVFFSKDEADYISSVPPHRRQDLFFDLWTMKESYIKLEGSGLALPLASFIIKYNETPVRVQCPITGQNLAFIKQYNIDPCYKLSVCSRQSLFDNLIIHLNYSPRSCNTSSLCCPKAGGGSTALSSIFSR